MLLIFGSVNFFCFEEIMCLYVDYYLEADNFWSELGIDHSAKGVARIFFSFKPLLATKKEVSSKPYVGPSLFTVWGPSDFYALGSVSLVKVEQIKSYNLSYFGQVLQVNIIKHQNNHCLAQKHAYSRHYRQDVASSTQNYWIKFNDKNK